MLNLGGRRLGTYCRARTVGGEEGREVNDERARETDVSPSLSRELLQLKGIETYGISAHASVLVVLLTASRVVG